MQYKVTYYLMIDPSKNDDTFKKSYTVEAEDEKEAYSKAEKLKDSDEPNIALRSVFDYKITNLLNKLK